jgi:hypothetical protein
LQFVIEDPLRYMALSVSRIPAYFMFWPSEESSLISNLSRTLSFGVTLPFMVYGLLRAPFQESSRERFGVASPIVLLMAFIGVYSLIHLLSWALIRYRLPVDAVLLVFASLAIADLIPQIRKTVHRRTAGRNIAPK